MGSMRMTSDLMVYKIDASRCDLRVGDLVAPGMAIGEDFDTGAMLKTEVHGQVEGIHFSGADHALVVLVRVDTPPVLAEASPEGEESCGS